MNEPTDPRHLSRETKQTRARYDRLAPLYDSMEYLAERLGFSRWRPSLWQRVRGPRVLELGVGTGKNFSYYPQDMDITAIDISPKMIDRARKKAEREGTPVRLELGDAQDLHFPEGSFDTVVATFVFCSVPDPIQGLREAARVLKPGGQLLLLEHVLSEKRVLKPIMNVANPVVVRIMGANINRQTVRNVERAGFRVESVDELWVDIVKLIEAEAKGTASD
jgi:phosphatidylethanolamine/phosphatidyl-N-methylethanolamine N-methyltransferase